MSENLNKSQFLTNGFNKKYSYNCSILYCITFGILGGVISSLGSNIIFMSERSGVQESYFGNVVFLRSTGFLIGSLLLGKILDKIDNHKAIVLGLLITISSYLLFLFTYSFYLYQLLYFIQGFGVSIIFIQCNNLLMVVNSKTENLNSWMQFLHLLFAVGAFITPAIQAQLGYQNSTFYIIFSLLILIFPILQIQSPEITDKIRMSVKNSFFKIQQNEQTIIEQEQEQDKTKNQTQLQDLQQNPNISQFMVIVVGILLFIVIGFEVSYGNWVASYNSLLGLSKKEDGMYATSLFWLGIGTGRFIAIFLSKKLDQIQYLYISFILSIVFSLIFNVFPMNIQLLYICSFGYGTANGPVYPFVLTLAEALKLRIKSEQTNEIIRIANYGDIVVPLLMGYGINFFGTEAFKYSVLFFSICMIVFFKSCLIIADRQFIKQQQNQDQFKDDIALQLL